MNVTILSEFIFERKILPNIESFENHFFISIKDPDEISFRSDSENFRTFYIYDINEDIGNYEAFTFEQAKNMLDFMKSNYGKHLIVHCHAGVSRSSAVGEFYHELFGGSYKDLKEKFPNILPNPRILQFLRMADTNHEDLKINYT